MNAFRTWTPAIALLMAVGLTGCGGKPGPVTANPEPAAQPQPPADRPESPAEEPPPEQAGPAGQRNAVIAAIEELRGQYSVDRSDPDRPLVVSVDLRNTAAGDDDLEQIEKLTNIEELYLSMTKVTEAHQHRRAVP